MFDKEDIYLDLADAESDPARRMEFRESARQARRSTIVAELRSEIEAGGMTPEEAKALLASLDEELAAERLEDEVAQ